MKLPNKTLSVQQFDALHRDNVERLRLAAEKLDMERRQRELIRPVSRWIWLVRLLTFWR